MSHPLNPFYSVDEHDTAIRMALHDIWATYNDAVSVEQNRKVLLKFGRNNYVGNVETATIAEFHDTGIANETYLTENKISALVSDDTGDAGTVFRLEGATIDTGSGFTSSVQDVTCNGQTPVQLNPPLARADELYIPALTWPNEARPATGKISVYDTGSTTVASGVPQTGSAVKLLIDGADAEDTYQTQKAGMSTASDEYWIVTEVGISITRDNSTATRVSAELEYKELGGVWKSLGLNIVINTDAESFRDVKLTPHLIVPKNSDVRLRALSSRASTQVTGYINGYLAKVMTDTL